MWWLLFSMPIGVVLWFARRTIAFLWWRAFGAPLPAPQVHEDDRSLVTDEDLAAWNQMTIQAMAMLDHNDQVSALASFIALRKRGLSADEAALRCRLSFPYFYSSVSEREVAQWRGEDSNLPLVLRERVDAIVAGVPMEQLRAGLSDATTMNAMLRRWLRRGRSPSIATREHVQVPNHEELANAIDRTFGVKGTNSANASPPDDLTFQEVKFPGTSTTKERGHVRAMWDFSLRREGHWEFFYENGQRRSEVTFKNGKEEGLVTVWHENGQKRSESTCVGGKEEGRVSVWDENGHKVTDIDFHGGVPDGLVTNWHPNGQKRAEETYRAGVLEGPTFTWYATGQKNTQVPYVAGKKDGLMTTWRENGDKQSEATFKNGVRDGPEIHFHESGRKSSVALWAEGKVSSALVFDDVDDAQPRPAKVTMTEDGAAFSDDLLASTEAFGPGVLIRKKK